MAERTLSDLNIELEAVNKTLDEQTVGQGRLIDAVEDLVQLQRRNLDDLEDKVEGTDDTPVTAQPRGAGGGGRAGGESFTSGVLGKIPSLAGLPALAGALGFKAIPKLLAITMADEIGEYITSQTGNAEVGSAVERGLVAGGIGSFFGKKFGLIAGIVGAALTDENQKKLGELGDALAPKAEALKTAVSNLIGVQLPTTDQIFQGITTTFGNALDGLTQLATGDFEGFTKNLDDLALSAAGIFALLAPGSALRLGMKGVSAAALAMGATLPKTKTPTGTTKTPVTPKGTALSKSGNLMKAGVDGKATTVAASDSQKAKFLKSSKAVSKFPKLLKALNFIRGIPGIGALSAVAELATMDPVTVEGLAGVLGGLGGSTLGAIAGGIVGSVLPGPGTLIGTILGGGAGYFFGGAIAEGLAQFLMGKTVDAFPKWMGINQLLNGSGGDAATPSPSTGNISSGIDGGLAAAAAGGGMSTPPRTTGASVAQSVNQFEMNRAQPAQVINAPSTNMSIGQSTTTFAGGGVSTSDPRRPNLSVGTSY
jgi:hypothetical protein